MRPAVQRRGGMGILAKARNNTGIGIEKAGKSVEPLKMPHS
ncbi:MAG TPA: hypothetical protein VFN25_07775 [Dokdonella sp.]|nr:hypothetical protein [Dokdonella sp.]HET9032787.1 hypothetical protein [Dokdonella sp.]